MRGMMTAAVAACSVAVAAGSAWADNVYTVRGEPGGNVAAHYYKYQQVAAQYDRVVIDGMCKSACTMLLGVVPLDRICITPRGYFMFHAGHDRGNRMFNQRATQTMLAAYAPEVRDWVTRHHALDRVDPYTYLYARDVSFIRHCGAGSAGMSRHRHAG